LEIKVEGGAGNARAFGQVVDGEVGQRPFLQQPLGGGQDRLFAVVTRIVRRTAAAGGVHLLALPGVGHVSYFMDASIYVNEIVDDSQQYCRLNRRFFSAGQSLAYPGRAAAPAPRT
jgi:hypothetical protein